MSCKIENHKLLKQQNLSNIEGRLAYPDSNNFFNHKDVVGLLILLGLFVGIYFLIKDLI